MKRINFLLLSAVAVCSLVSCGGGSKDSSKTQLYVGYYDAGVGRDWIKNSVADFEAAYADYSFQTGKKGVQVQIAYDRVGLAGDNLIGTISSKPQSVIITENINYYTLVSGNKLHNLSNVINQKDTVYQDSKTIAEKMDSDLTDYLSMIDGNVYALPYYEGLMGFQYDVDLFENYNFYFKMQPDGKPVTADATSPRFDSSQYFVTSKNDQRSYGPDGKTGTENGIDYSLDDGLPSTFNEFYALEKQMVSNNITPFLWCSNYTGYLNDEMVALLADIEGKEQFNLNNTWSGTSTDLIDVTADGTVTSRGSTAITVDNANLLQKQAGRYETLKFAKQIVSDPSYYYPDYGQTHTVAQRMFLTQGKYGMLCDGCWWENEGKSNFSTTDESKSRLSRKLGMMPFPKTDVAAWEAQSGSTYFSENKSMMFINGNVSDDMVECSEAFMRFIHQDSQLSKFTQTTSMARPFDYEMSEDDLSNTSYYGRQMYQIRKRITSSDCNDSVVYYYPLNLTTAKNEDTIHKDNWYFVGSDSLTNPMLAFESDANLTAETYFNKLYENKKNWSPTK